MNKTATNDEFVAIWNSCEDATKAAERLGRAYSTVVSRAHKLRVRGYPVKKMPKLFEKDPSYASQVVSMANKKKAR